MFGAGDHIGIIGRSVELILESKFFTISIVENIGNDLFDIISGSKIKISTIDGANGILIRSASAFNQLLVQMLKIRSQKSTNQNETSSRSHLIFNLRLEGDTNGKLTFVDLAGWESPNNKDNLNETIFINSSLTSLNTVFEKISKKQPPSYDSTLAKFFKPYLTSTSKICMLYHVSKDDVKKGFENVKNIVASNKEVKRRRSPFRDISNELKRKK